MNASFWDSSINLALGPSNVSLFTLTQHKPLALNNLATSANLSTSLRVKLLAAFLAIFTIVGTCFTCIYLIVNG